MGEMKCILRWFKASLEVSKTIFFKNKFIFFLHIKFMGIDFLMPLRKLL